MHLTPQLLFLYNVLESVGLVTSAAVNLLNWFRGSFQVASDSQKRKSPEMFFMFIVDRTTVAHKGHENPAIYFGKFEW